MSLPVTVRPVIVESLNLTLVMEDDVSLYFHFICHLETQEFQQSRIVGTDSYTRHYIGLNKVCL